ncbi:hypothetical protein BN7_3500 [Wickerhamomyces ciferrii]|uniref:Uncharacterized protein n=1 Tax=Wickerhamomyces ciferrii (strain ATCC 14091 / BCRC 22168 / CBS 111 / JCM 3599 / NBRC 0793 / NRRL Y-1031 F-60-10) TaxID=1206466 RepID=K0KFM9_WICCF|nr:uncharacterized protein BN7_3500 [Wickerhamomyces ciferrii]CCH43945.1 hypothetical protein BN7_3500 [Wickerhamomyces ciferrii]
MITSQGSIPEVKEDIPGASIDERSHRLKTFVDLGPPDLVALTKQVPNSKSPEIGTYLYYTGLENTSTSSVAAHLNSLANVIGSSPQHWFGKSKPWKVTKAVYVSYNAFSRVDVVVTAHIPGAVSSYVIDGYRERIQENDRIWLETFASGIIRSLLTSEEDEEQVNAVVESRNLNPFQNVETAKQFFVAFEELFEQGPDVGSAPEIQTPTIISNYLVDAFLKAVELTGLYDDALSILERLREKEELVVSLIVKVLLLKDEEIKAVKLLHEGIKRNPRDANLLTIQSQFLLEKNRLDLALPSAVQAVNSAPSEFNPWANLAKVYLESGNVEQALLALNSCPMAAYKEKFHLKRIIPTTAEKLHLPLPVDVTLDDVSSLDSARVAQEHNSVDQALVNLQAANLKSTFAKAYDILTEIVHRTGWESLLKYRAKIFVMEEEYRSKSSSQTNVLETAANGKATDGENSFKKKRLCERWLDNLFMLLYDDLRTYTMWQAEMIHFQAQKTQYEKLPVEWELLGMVAFRLHHYKEAANAFQRALEIRFAPTSTRNLLKYYQLEIKNLKQKADKSHQLNGHNNKSTTSLDHGNLSPQQLSKKIAKLDENILDTVVRLSAWNHRWYCEFAPYLLTALAKVIGREGLVKIQNEVRANYPDTGVNELLDDSFEFFRHFEVFGSET